MTDLELLQLAAKAADLPMCESWNCAADGCGILIGYGYGDLKPWNPLGDEGDAFRLAIQLRIRFARHCQPFVAAFAPDIVGRFEEPEGEDPYAAARRAIVRAAAEIGKAK